MNHTYPIKTFDPLLRDLVAWGLVVRSGTEARPAWRLSEAAQRRLNEVVPANGVAGDEQLVYLNHRCTDCHLWGLTRLIDGVYLCQDCSEHRAIEPGENEDLATPAVRSTRWRRRRRVEGSEPTTALFRGGTG